MTLEKVDNPAEKLKADLASFIDHHPDGKTAAQHQLADFLGLKSIRTIQKIRNGEIKVTDERLFKIYWFLMKPKSKEDLLENLLPFEIKKVLNFNTCSLFNPEIFEQANGSLDRGEVLEVFNSSETAQKIIFVASQDNGVKKIPSWVISRKFGSEGEEVLKSLISNGVILKDMIGNIRISEEAWLIFSEGEGARAYTSNLHKRIILTEEESQDFENRGLVYYDIECYNKAAIEELQALDKEYLSKRQKILKDSSNHGNIAAAISYVTKYGNVILKEDNGTTKQ